MNKTTNTQTASARGLLAALIIALALAFAAIPSLVLAADADDEFTDAASDIVIEEDSPDDGATEPDQSPEPDADAPDPDSDPEPASYSLRLIVSADDGALRDGDAVLGSHDGVHLLGFPDEDALAEAESYYAEAAAWSDRDIALTAADDEPTESTPAPVDETNNAFTLLESPVGAQTSAPAGEAGTPQPELTSAAEGGTTPLIALIDTGAPDDPSVVASATFVGDDPADNHGHATAMLEAMKSENPDVRILAIKALGDDGEGSASSVYAAIEYAVEQGADIISLSLAGYANDENAAIAEAVARALENGIVVIAAAGNGGYDAAYFTPANIAGVFAVGACDEDGNVLETSNRGDCVSGYIAAGSTSAAAARLSGWASATSGDRELADCPFLFSPEDASCNGVTAPEPNSSGGLLSAATTCSGILLIEPCYSRSIGAVDWYYDLQSGLWKDSTKTWWTQGSYANPEKLYLYPNYNPGGIALVGNRKNNDTYRKYRVVGMNVADSGMSKKGHFRGVFTGRWGSGRQLISSHGVMTSDLENGAMATGTPGNPSTNYAYFVVDEYNVYVGLNPGETGIEQAGSRALYIIDDHERITDKSIQKSDGVYVDEGASILLGTSHGVNSSSWRPITVPTRSDGYSFDGYYTEPDGGGKLVVTRDGLLNMMHGSVSESGLNGDASSGWDTELYAKWVQDGVITLNSQGAATQGTSGLYVEGNKRVLAGPTRSATEFTSTTKIALPTRDGYTFRGYYTQPGGAGTLMIGPDGTKTSALTTSAKGQTLYAAWFQTTYSFYVNLNDNGGVGGPGQLVMTVINNNLDKNFNLGWLREASGATPGLSRGFSLTSASKPHMGIPSAKRFVGYDIVTERGVRERWIDKDLNIIRELNLGYYKQQISVSVTLHAKFSQMYSDSAYEKQVEDRIRTLLASAGFAGSVWADYTGANISGARSSLDYSLSGSEPEWYGKNRGYATLNWGSWGSLSATVNIDIYANVNQSYRSNMPLSWNSTGAVSTFKVGDNAGVPITNSFETESSIRTYASVTAPNLNGYAVWEGWPLTLNACGGSFAGVSTFYEVYGDGLYAQAAATTKVKSLPVPTKIGYTFGGWYQHEGGKGLCLADATGTVTNDLVSAYKEGDTTWCTESASAKPVYAYWIPNIYTITLDQQDADVGAEGTTALYELYDSGVFLSEKDVEAAKTGDTSTAMSTTAHPIEIPKKESYVFGGYFDESSGKRYIDENGYVTGIFASNAFIKDMTLYAKWIDPRAVLPLAGGFAENMPLLWGSAFAIVGASGFVLFRALRPNRAIRRKAAHGARRDARQASRASVRSNAVARPNVRTRHAR